VRALFVTSEGQEPATVMSGWSYWNEPCRRVTFGITGAKNDVKILEAAKEFSPDIIFYIGGAQGAGLPTIETLRALRNIAKSISLVCDATDHPWHPALIEYKENECFDLQVGLDGSLEAPVDMNTVTPLDPRIYDTKPSPARDIRCGFSGQQSTKTVREMLISILESKGLIMVRPRTSALYGDYAMFLRHCEMVFNVGLTGTAERLHIKGRVIESGLAGAALLEMEGSPADKWFPRKSIFFYRTVEDAEKIIRHASKNEVADKAAMLSEIVRTKYNPQKIYGEMLERVGLK